MSGGAGSHWSVVSAGGQRRRLAGTKADTGALHSGNFSHNASFWRGDRGGQSFGSDRLSLAQHPLHHPTLSPASTQYTCLCQDFSFLFFSKTLEHLVVVLSVDVGFLPQYPSPPSHKKEIKWKVCK